MQARKAAAAMQTGNKFTLEQLFAFADGLDTDDTELLAERLVEVVGQLKIEAAEALQSMNDVSTLACVLALLRDESVSIMSLA